MDPVQVEPQPCRSVVAELYGVRVGVVLWHGTRLHGTTNDLKDDVASQRDECCSPNNAYDG